MSLKQLAKDVLELIERGHYCVDGVEVSIDKFVQESLNGSRLYTPEQLASLRNNVPDGNRPDVEVTAGTTQSVARDLADTGPLTLLNFASARNPGGGFLNGAKAQEEDLCRCSALYSTLIFHPEYYEANRKQSSLLYTDYAIYSPTVPFFKTRGTGELLAEPFVASVITAPAPNTRPYLAGPGDPGLLEQCFERRWRNVLSIAKDAGAKSVLLGAWGCGAFGGDPVLASETAKRAIETYGPAFERVVFAIPAKGKRSKHNHDVFANTFGVDQLSTR